MLITHAFDVGLPWVTRLRQSRRSRWRRPVISARTSCSPIRSTRAPAAVRAAERADRAQHDEELIGKTLCLAKGWSRFDLDKEGRGRLKDGKVTLVQRQTPEDCFRLLAGGTADALSCRRPTGAAIASAMGLSGRVRAAERPTHIDTMHAIVAKKHPDARAILNAINGACPG